MVERSYQISFCPNNIIVTISEDTEPIWFNQIDAAIKKDETFDHYPFTLKGTMQGTINTVSYFTPKHHIQGDSLCHPDNIQSYLRERGSLTKDITFFGYKRGD